MLSSVIPSWIRQTVLLVIVLGFLLSLNCIAPLSVNAYSLKNLKQEVTEAADISNSVIETVINIDPNIGNKALQASKVTLNRAVQAGAKVGNASLKTSKAAANRALEVGDIVGDKALQAGKTAAAVAVDTTTKVNSSASKVGRAAIGVAADVSVMTAKETELLVGQAVESIKSASKRLNWK